MKLSDLRPCDNCGGKVYPQFYVLRMSLAIIKGQAVNEFLGMRQFFGGKSDELAMMFSPSAGNAVIVAGDEEPALMDEFFICYDCLKGPLDLARLGEKVHAGKESSSEADDVGPTANPA